MSKWTKWNAKCTSEDRIAFNRENHMNEHFGFPYCDVFSKATNDAGLINVCEQREDKSKPPRRQYLSNLMAIKYVKLKYPDAKVWDERYEFNGEIKQSYTPYENFKLAFGVDRLKEIATLARSRGIGMKSSGEFLGKLDMAVYFPGEEVWRFIEVKHDSTTRQEGWRPFQTDWLELLADFLGVGFAIELRFRDEPLGYR